MKNFTLCSLVATAILTLAPVSTEAKMTERPAALEKIAELPGPIHSMNEKYIAGIMEDGVAYRYSIEDRRLEVSPNDMMGATLHVLNINGDSVVTTSIEKDGKRIDTAAIWYKNGSFKVIPEIGEGILDNLLDEYQQPLMPVTRTLSPNGDITGFTRVVTDMELSDAPNQQIGWHYSKNNGLTVLDPHPNAPIFNGLPVHTNYIAGSSFNGKVVGFSDDLTTTVSGALWDPFIDLDTLAEYTEWPIMTNSKGSFVGIMDEVVIFYRQENRYVKNEVEQKLPEDPMILLRNAVYFTENDELLLFNKKPVSSSMTIYWNEDNYTNISAEPGRDFAPANSAFNSSYIALTSSDKSGTNHEFNLYKLNFDVSSK